MEKHRTLTINRIGNVSSNRLTRNATPVPRYCCLLTFASRRIPSG